MSSARPRIDDSSAATPANVGSRVADAVAAGLDGVHLDGREQRRIWERLEPRPIELDVLPGGEVAVSPVVISEIWASSGACSAETRP